jgi:hypothetical protein
MDSALSVVCGDAGDERPGCTVPSHLPTVPRGGNGDQAAAGGESYVSFASATHHE